MERRSFRGLAAAFLPGTVGGELFSSQLCPGGFWDGTQCVGAGPTLPTVPGQICPSWGCEGFNPISFNSMGACPAGFFWNGNQCVPDSASPVSVSPGQLTAPVTTVPTAAGPVATTIDPTTGKVVTSIPPSGPQPPGAGYQQVEAPGSPYPYVYIGGSQPSCPPGYEAFGNQCMPVPGLAAPAVPGAGGIGVDNAYPNWMAGNPPNGSYLQSCTNVQSDGAGNLFAECKDVAGQYHQTSLYYGQCETAPYNQDGELGCGGVGGQQIFTPATGAPGSVIAGSGCPLGYQSYAGQCLPVQGNFGSPYTTASPWSVYQTYYAGQTVSYGGATWTALSTSIGIAPGSNTGYWTMTGATQSLYPFAASPYSPTIAQQTLQTPTAARTAAPSTVTQVENWFSQYKWWIVAGLAGAVVLPRLMKR